MMKTTLATVAVAAVIATTDAAFFQSPITAAKIAEDAKCAATLVEVGRNALVASPLGYLVELTGLGADAAAQKTALDACVAEIKATAAADETKAGECFVGETPVYTAGTNSVCPLAYGATCAPATTDPVAAAQVCQNKDNTGTACGAEKVCLYDVVPAKSLEVTAKFKTHYKTASKDVPTKVSEAIAAAYTAAKCDAVYPQSQYGYPSNKKGTNYVSGRGVTADCDAAKVKTDVDAAVKAWNDDAANKDKKFEGSYETKVVDFAAKCFVAKDATVACKTTADCTIPCADDITCTADDICGSTWCKDTTAAFMAQADPAPAANKKCFSNAVASVVAPVLAAALAIAFF